MTSSAQQDESAVAAVRRGDAERYRELVERHERRVYAVAWRRLGDAALAEDVALHHEFWDMAVAVFPLLDASDRRDFLAALKDNANWAQPSLFFFLANHFGTATGLIAWGLAAVVIFGFNLWFWKKCPPAVWPQYRR